MTFLKIDGVVMPPPTKYDVSLNDIDAQSSGRTEAGYMKRKRIRSNVGKLSVGWTNVTKDELETILEAVKRESFPVEFYFGKMVSATMYAGDKSISFKVYKDGVSYWDINFNLIEN